MIRALAWLGAAGLVVAVALTPRPAGAYVRYLTKAGNTFIWPQSCVPLTAYPNDLTDMSPSDTLQAALAAAESWGPNPNVCTYLEIQLYMSPDMTPKARYDQRNSLIFRHDSWCKWDDKPGDCSYDPSALALTSVFVTPEGHIRDGDIEVNARDFIWTNITADPSPQGKQDLQNALTHEMGHLIGLDHSCIPSGGSTLDQYGHELVDNNNQPVPSCATASQAVKDSTMYPSATPGDITKRTLSVDDAEAVCAIYPVAENPRSCPGPNPPASSGCSTGAGAASNRSVAASSGLAAVAAFVGFLLRARRRKRC